MFSRGYYSRLHVFCFGLSEQLTKYFHFSLILITTILTQCICSRIPGSHNYSYSWSYLLLPWFHIGLFLGFVRYVLELVHTFIYFSLQLFQIFLFYFVQHSGLSHVNPANGVLMDTGVTIAHWPKLFFQKLGVRNM